MSRSVRMTITLKTGEAGVLAELAYRERRDPRDQAAYLIREGLERRSLLPSETEPPPQPAVGQDEQPASVDVDM